MVTSTREAAATAPPELATDRLLLVPPSERHVADVFDYGGDPEFCAYISARPFTSQEQARDFLRALIDDNFAGRRSYWVVTLKDTGAAIGTMGFNFLFDRSSGVADFGYGIARSHWGAGLFQEAARAVVRYGFETLGLKRIQATTRADNARSVRGVEKAGFRREAELRSFYATTTGRADAVVLAILAGEYRT